MRVSTQMQFSLSVRTVNQRQSELLRTQEQIATGRRINSFAEDPVASRKVLREQANLRQVESGRRTSGDAQLLLENAESALIGVADALQRAYELNIQLANDSFDAPQRRSGADEIRQIREQILSLANTERNGRYLFSGLGNTADPFQLDGTFNGDAGRLTVPVSRNTTVDATVAGGEPFLDAAGGRNTLESLAELEDALRANDSVQINAMIDEMLGTLERSTAARQQIGQRLQRLEFVDDVLARTELAANATLAVERDTDISEAVIRLRESESGLQAALAITGRLDDLSLLNFI
ncbi:MAG: flagellar hook-associated protein FlgL [Myxococcota bacterium]